ncbi:MAG: hypothetical protein QRY74_05640 [Chlamydia sp.]
MITYPYSTELIDLICLGALEKMLLIAIAIILFGYKRIAKSLSLSNASYSENYEKKIQKYWLLLGVVIYIYFIVFLPLILLEGKKLSTLPNDGKVSYYLALTLTMIINSIFFYGTGYFGGVKKEIGPLILTITYLFLLNLQIGQEKNYLEIVMTGIKALYWIISIQLYRINSYINRERTITILADKIHTIKLQNLLSRSLLLFFISIVSCFSTRTFKISSYLLLFFLTIRVIIRKNSKLVVKKVEKRVRKQWILSLTLLFLTRNIDLNFTSKIELIIAIVKNSIFFLILYHFACRKKGTNVLVWLISIPVLSIFIDGLQFYMPKYEPIPILFFSIKILFWINCVRLYFINSSIKNQVMNINTYRPYIYV